MLLTPLLHPGIVAALAAAGHGSTVLLADGHYPASTATNPRAQLEHLNLTPGVLDVTTVLRCLLDAVPIESAAVMVPPHGEREPAAIGEYRSLLDPRPVAELDRFAFYEQARDPSLALAVVTADVRTYANLLVTIGVRDDV